MFKLVSCKPGASMQGAGSEAPKGQGLRNSKCYKLIFDNIIVVILIVILIASSDTFLFFELTCSVEM